NSPTLTGSSTPPTAAQLDLNLSHPTHSESFGVFIPFANKLGAVNPDFSPGSLPPALDRFFQSSGTVSQLDTITGPTGYGPENLVPAGQPLPYTIGFENDPRATTTANSVQILSKLDPSLDPRRFSLGDIQIGDILVQIPAGLATYQADLNYAQS